METSVVVGSCYDSRDSWSHQLVYSKKRWITTFCLTKGGMRSSMMIELPEYKVPLQQLIWNYFGKGCVCLALMPVVKQKMTVMWIFILIIGNLRSLIQYYDFVIKLEQVLNHHMDVVTTEIQNETFLQKIMQDGGLLYECQGYYNNNKMIKYCEDIELLIKKYNQDFRRYTTDISFQYSCNMCIIQLGELAFKLSEDVVSQNPQIPWQAIRGC